jgi:hypothetical protein
MRSDFLNGLLFLDRLQRDSSFHVRAEASPLPRFHSRSVSEAAILHLIDWSEFWGTPQGRKDLSRYRSFAAPGFPAATQIALGFSILYLS